LVNILHVKQLSHANDSRYHFVFSHKTQQIFFLHHLVIGLALDIGLHRDYQPLHFPNQPKAAPPNPKDQRERERAFLGCYYLSSMCVANTLLSIGAKYAAGLGQVCRSQICSSTHLT
jgi:hypothetical protein